MTAQAAPGLDFAFSELDKAARYKLLSGVIVPRS